jgi:hypothetical protein
MLLAPCIDPDRCGVIATSRDNGMTSRDNPATRPGREAGIALALVGID